MSRNIKSTTIYQFRRNLWYTAKSAPNFTELEPGISGTLPRDRCWGEERAFQVSLLKGSAILDIRTSLVAGCKDAGIPYGRKVENGFTFHDLRHTAKTIARKAGVDKNVRMVIFGHANPNDMDLRYDTVDEGDLTQSTKLRLFWKIDTIIVTIAQKKAIRIESFNGVTCCFNCGAEGESRTRTSIRTLDPETKI